MSELGKLYYSLGLDTKGFDDTLHALKSKIKDLDGKDITVSTKGVESAISKLESLQNAINALQNTAEIRIGNNNTISPKLNLFTETEANELRSKIEKALENISLKNVDVSKVVAEISNAGKGGYEVTLTCNRNSVAPLLANLKDILAKSNVTVRLYPLVSKEAMQKFRTSLESKLQNLKVKSINIEVANKRAVQEKLNAITGLTIPVEVQLHTKTLQSQLDRLKGSLTLSGENLGTGSERSLENRKKTQREITKSATDELGVRRAINDQMSKNTQLATMLGNAMGNVFAAYQLKNFLEALIQIGGEIQKQRLALGHIIGSVSDANVLFGQMKDLAVKSPYGLLDLMKNARQLSAFGVEYNNLYDTMKRLSDVASGLGVDFGRISLAFGETMERGFLDGKLVRQFSYMGLPVLQKIAEYYTDINKAGNGSIFSASDVRKMVSNREVGFEDLSEVIKRMTNEGGQFYNMQEVMAESVAGKWKNLKDAYDIMLSDMTEGNSELLKAPAEFLTSLTRNYDYFIPLLTMVGTAMMGTNMMAKLLNATLGEQIAVTYREALAEKQHNAVLKQREAAIRGASSAQLARLNAERMLTAEEAKQLYTSGKLSETELKYIALKQGANKANAQLLLQTKLITQEQYKQLMTGAKWGNMLTLMKIRTQMFGLQVGVATAQLRAMTYAMLHNPMTWFMVAISAVMELGMMINKVDEANKKLRDGMRNTINDVSTNAKDIEKQVTIKVNYDHDSGKYTTGATFAQMQTAIDSLVEFIKDKMPGAQEILDEAFELNDNDEYKRSIEERYLILKNYYDSIRAFADDASTKDIIDDMTDKLSARWYNAIFNDDLLRDAADYEKNFKNVKNSLVSALNDASADVDKVIKDWQKKMGVNNLNALIEEMLKPTDESYSKYRAFMSDLKNKIGYLDYAKISWGYNNYKADFKEYQNELEGYMTEIENIIKSHGLDLNKKEDKKKVEFLIHTYLEQTDASAWVKEHMVQDFATNWKLNISMGGGVKQEDDWLKGLFGGYAKETISESYDEIKKSYKDLSGKLKSLQEGVLKGAKRNTNGSYAFTFGLEHYVNEANGYVSEMQKLADIAKREGISLVDAATGNKGGSGAKKDTILEQFKERVDALKKAYSEFQKWSAKVGKDKAAEELGKLGLMGGLKKEDLADTKAYLEQINKLISEWSAKVGKDVARKKEMTALLQLKADIELNIKEEELKRAAEKVQREINNTAKQFDIWKIWFEATGNTDTALAMSKNIGIAWNKQSEDLLKMLQDKIGSREIDFTFGADVSAIDTEKAFQALGEDGNELFTIWKAINDQVVNYGIELRKNAASAMKEIMTYAEKIDVLEKQRQDAIKGANGNKDIIEKINVSFDSKIAELDPEYKRFMSNVTTMTKEAALAMGNAIKDRLLKELNIGAKSVEEYANAVAKVDEQIKKSMSRIKSFGEAWILGKVGEYRKSEYEDARYNEGVARKAAEETRKALEKIQAQTTDSSNAEQMNALNDAMSKNIAAEESLKKATKALEKAFNSYRKQTEEEKNNSLVGAVIGKFNNIISGISTLTESLESVFGENSLKGFKDFLSSANKTSQAANAGLELGKNFGKNGGAYGAVIGGFVGAIGSFFDYDNKRQEKRFEELLQRIEITKEIRDLLAKNLQNSVGKLYSTGLDDVSRDKLLELQYSRNVRTSANGVSKDLDRLISQAIRENSYFKGQLALLKYEYQQTYQKVKELEAKNKSDEYNEEIEKARLELKELEREIENLGKDLANELYGIDFNSYAETLADSIVGAWQKGEDAVDAYKESVNSMLAEIAKSTVSQKILGTYLDEAIKPWLTKFENAKGIMTDEVFGDLNNIFEGLQVKVEESKTFIDAWESIANKYGYSMKDLESTSSASNSIKGITEEQADILAALIQGMRLDLSLQRTSVENILKSIGTEGRPLNEIAEAQLEQLSIIVENTRNNARAAQRIEDILNDVVTGAKAFNIE